MNEAGASLGEGPSAPHPFAQAEFDENKPTDTDAEEGTED
jgi:hypothetical protein